MRTAGGTGGSALALAAAAVAFCALFFGGGDANAPLVWVGGLALLLAAVCLARAPRLGGPELVFLGSLGGLVLWCGLSTIWSASPDRSWQFTNRTLVYAAFGLAGVLAGRHVRRDRLAEGAALLLALLVGWALLAKCVPALYDDYGRVARLRAPVDYWNELALLCDAGVALALWLASRRRVAGVVFLYALVVTVLLTYSRFGVALACAVAVAWIVLVRDRLESIAAAVLAGAGGAAVFGIALALPGITDDGQARSVRVQDGWIFALVLLAGAAAVALAARAFAPVQVDAERRARIERVTAAAALLVAAAGLAVSIAFAGQVWSDFTNPGSQLENSTAHLTSAKSNRWIWWEEAWHAFTHHPGGGTGAGTFVLTNQRLRDDPVVVDAPHNVPLQFLSETGIVGFLLYLGVAAGALWGAWRVRADRAALAVGIAVAAFFVHTIVDKDWNYVATSGPLLLLAGALIARTSPAAAPARRRLLLAAGAVAVAGAAIYSLTLPWLADRALGRADWEQAHAYNPLSVDALMEWATFEDALGNLDRANELYSKAVDLEPQNARTWYALGSFYFEHRLWRLAYDSLNNAYTYDAFGPAAKPCGLLDRARWNAGFRFGPHCK
ncbi:MAG TPA: O-antigen ligase family protein [Gaiellaceae bacterium]|nr:O-antigen ligase family protein [Gaiellaceae bacterium]